MAKPATKSRSTRKAGKAKASSARGKSAKAFGLNELRALAHLGESVRGTVIRGKYDAAQTTDENINHWKNADLFSPAAAVAPDVRKKIRSRARYECENNTYAQGMVETKANDVIGTGPALGMETGIEDFDNAFELAWQSWADENLLPLTLRTACESKIRDGESFLRAVTNPRSEHFVQLALRVYEGDQVTEQAGFGFNQATTATDGVVYDDFGNVVAYRLLRNHPGDISSVSNESDLIPAGQMIHWFNQHRATQPRGVSEIASALPLYAQLRRFTLAVIAAAETAADIAAFLESNVTENDPEDIIPLETIEFVKRMLMTLPRGWKLNQLKAEQPATTYEMFKRAILSEIARCLHMPYNVAAGDSSSYNYASGRMDHQVYFKSIGVERNTTRLVVLEKILRWFWLEFRLTAPAAGIAIPPALAALRVPPAHTWRWNGEEHVDPLKTAQATTANLENLTDTLADAWGRSGHDWVKKITQIAKERKLLKELGITVAQAAPKPGDQKPPAKDEAADDETNDEETDDAEAA